MTREYTLSLRDEGGSEELIYFDADSETEAIEEANSRVDDDAETWCKGGDWGTQGGPVKVTWDLKFEDGYDIDSGYLTVDIEPNHRALIRQGIGGLWNLDAVCGDEPGDHDWTSEGDIEARSHCRECGLCCECGGSSQTEYWILDDDEIAEHREHGYMDPA